MTRSTKSVHAAIERLAPLTPAFLIEEAPERGRYYLSTTEDPFGLGRVSKRAINVLAMLADHARHSLDSEEVRERVRWSGSIPTRGVSSYEERALAWLAGWNTGAV